MICALNSERCLAFEIGESCPSLPLEVEPAFPGALGYGRFAKPCCIGVPNPPDTPIVVSTLADYKPFPYANPGEEVVEGSLRWALEVVPGPKRITFSVEGAINLKAPLYVTTPYCTIDGQSAPGEGITIQRREFGVRNTHNVIIRYMRFRSGLMDTQQPVYHCERSLLIFADVAIAHDILIDHCSIGASRDDNLAIAGRVCRVTIQHCLIGGGTVEYSKAGIITGGEADMVDGNITLCHNLFTNTETRQCVFGGPGRIDFFNNVCAIATYQTQLLSWNGVNGPQINILNNVYRAAVTPPLYTTLFDPVLAEEKDEVQPPGRPYLVVPTNDQKIYVEGNRYDRYVGTYPNGSYQPYYSGLTQQWETTVSVWRNQTLYPNLQTSLRRTSAPWPMPNDGADLTLTPQQVFDQVMANAGCRLPLPTPPDTTPGQLDNYDKALYDAVFTGERLYPNSPDATIDTRPGLAHSPSPPNSASNPIEPPVILSWTRGDETEAFDVYLWKCTNTDCNNAPPSTPLGTTTANSLIIPGNFEWEPGATYKWKPVPRNTCWPLFFSDVADWCFVLNESP